MKLSIFIIVVALIAPAAQAQPKPSPFFAAFQKFCADPDMTPQEVQMAIEVAGGKVNKPETITDSPYRMYTTSWDVTVQKHKLLINTGGSRAPLGPHMTQDGVFCMISDNDADDAAKAELNLWVAVAPSRSSRDLTIYDFEWNGQEHMPAPSGEAFRADIYAGKLWELNIIGSGKYTAVMLTHFLKAVPKSQEPH